MEQKMIDFLQSENEYSPLVLAFLGDAVYENYIRSRLVSEGNRGVNKLQKESSALSRAEAQFRACHIIADKLSEEETAVLHRGRNAKSASVPKNADVTHYRYATGLEALIGYLYIAGRHDRIETLMSIIYSTLRSRNEQEKNC